MGYDVSALVWSKLAFGLSAGRVQSVALRLIVDREREIEAFIPDEYWNVGVGLVGQETPQLRGPLGQRRRREVRGQKRVHGPSRSHWPRERSLQGRQDHAPRAKTQSARPVLDVEVAARRDELPKVHDQAHHAGRAGPLRRRRPRQRAGHRRAHHLHAYRLAARQRRRGAGRA